MRWWQRFLTLVVEITTLLIGIIGIYLFSLYLLGRINLSFWEIVHFVLQENAQVGLLISILIIFLTLITIRILYIIGKRRGFEIIMPLSGGNLQINSLAVEEYLENLLKNKEKILKKTEIKIKRALNKSLKIKADLQVSSKEENIPTISQRIQDYIKEKVENFIGYPNISYIQIKINKVE